MTQNINPMEVLKEQLDTDQIAIRVNAIHKIKIIAVLLGVDGIRNILLPFLDSLIKKQEDQVLFAIAEEIGNLAPLLGSQQMLLVPYLQNLSGQEQTVVRQMAVKSLTNIINTATDSEINNYLIPMIIRLASNQANFTCRVSAANLMCRIYPRSGVNKQKLRQKFTELSNQETPMVRRVIAIKIGQMANVYDKDHIITDLIPAFKQLANDDQDLVRVLCLDSLKSLAKVLPRDDNKTHTLPVIIQSAEDKSWRVRLSLSKNFSEIAESFGKEITDLSLIQTFSTLLKDVQNDVKIQAVKSLARFVRLVSPDKLNILIPLIITLGKDNSPIVRSNLTSVLSNTVGVISKDLAYQKILPLITDLMKDDNQQVRQGGIRAVAKFGESIGHDILNTIYPHLKAATEDPKWRVRSYAIEAVVTLALTYQNFDLFMKSLEPLFMIYLRDKAAAVRQLAIQKIPDLIRAFGNSWINIFITKLADILLKDSGYLFKISAIYSLKAIVTSPGGQSAVEKGLNLIFKSLNDGIPNVRFVCVKVLKQIGQRYENSNIRDLIKKSLNNMIQDSDKDVKFYSIQAIQSL